MKQLQDHKDKSRIEYQIQNSMRNNAAASLNNSTAHLVFDFAEKVTLPSIDNQPGQLHFITGLCYDIFGISLSNLKITNVYGLPEGRRPNIKDATSVLSMLWHSIQFLMRIQVTKNANKFVLHTDNCARQNKN